MKHLAFVLAVLGATACGSKKSDGAGDPCETSINKAIDGMLGSRKGPPEMQEQMKAIGDKLRTIMIGSCKTDHWPADVLDCFSAATDQPSIKACRNKLPPEQAQHLQAEIMKVMTGGMGGAGPMHGAPPAAPPPSGSDTPQPMEMGTKAGSGSSAP
jgi:hypothetical protein